MKLQRFGIVFGLIVAFATAAPTQAAFTWNIATPDPGSTLTIKLRNYEVVYNPDGSLDSDGLVDEPGDELFGIFKISSIIDDNTAQTYWVDGINGELSGIFSGYTARDLPVGFPGEVDFTGGLVETYFHDTFGPAGPFAAAITAGPAGAAAILTAGSAFLTAEGVGGIDNEGDPDVTLQSIIGAVSAGQFQGEGEGFLDVTFSSDIAWGTDAMDPGSNPGDQDLKFNFRFTTADAPAGWDLVSDDPVTGRIVPEPTAVLTWSLLMGSAAVLGLRRRRAKLAA